MKTILEICREVADLAAVQRPTDLFASEDLNSQIWLSVAKSELESLLRYGNWQELTKEAQFLTACGQSNYRIDDFVPDFYCLLPNTIYIKDSSERVIGAITPEQWTREKMFNCPSLDIKFKIQNNVIRFLNPPQCYKFIFQYRSNGIVWDHNTFTEKSALTDNNDVPIFDEYLVKLGILWRWLKRTGLDYTEEYNEYEKELKKRFGESLATRDINLAGPVLDDCAEVANVIVYKSCQ